MQRDKAISIICKNELKNLSKKMRQDIVLNWWGIDEEDPEFHRLPNTLQVEILSSDEAPLECSGSKYDPLLLEALKRDFVGVTNEYLAELVSQITNKYTEVFGEEEQLLACPCCHYQTIQDRGMYDICPVCQWEDDGTDHSDSFSSPNHMTLSEGRNNFSKYGSVNKRDGMIINSDMKKRYRITKP